jgi:N-acyl-D-aspartate/D-glutamate deacylase
MRLFLFALSASLLAAQDFDVALNNGRVIDPESGLDAVRSIGIKGGKITRIANRPLRGKTSIDAMGLVISPGFIDLHSHGQTPENYKYKARDGVTTALEMEIGVFPVAEWYRERQGKALVNYGGTVSHPIARMKVLGDTGSWLPRDRAIATIATPEQHRATLENLRAGMREGGLGVGFGIGYVPGCNQQEIMEAFAVAAEFKRPGFVHTRDGRARMVESLQEVIANSAVTGAPLHVVHIQASSGKYVDTAIKMVEGARARGIDVTMEAYPYTAGQTQIESSIFDPGWQERLGADFGDLVWVKTGERLTKETFEKYRKIGGSIVTFTNKEEYVDKAIAHPHVMIASDGMIYDGQGHPRGAGTYARILAVYVRERKVLTLRDAIAKMSLLPAKRLEAYTPSMRNKGRIRAGADADLVLFDPDKVQDKATYTRPNLYSEGIPHVLVGGEFVVRDSKPGFLESTANRTIGVIHPEDVENRAGAGCNRESAVYRHHPHSALECACGAGNRADRGVAESRDGADLQRGGEDVSNRDVGLDGADRTAFEIGERKFAVLGRGRKGDVAGISFLSILEPHQCTPTA